MGVCMLAKGFKGGGLSVSSRVFTRVAGDLLNFEGEGGRVHRR